MNHRLLLIRQQRKLLQIRTQFQRLELADAAQPCYRTLKMADIGLNGVMYLRDHPFMIGMLSFLLVFKPKGKAGMWLGRILSVWEMYQTVKSAAKRTSPM